MIPAAARPSLEGVVPSVIATSSAQGVPNLSYVSQVWYVDPNHVAVSHQYFNKTMANLREVPFACAQAFDPRTLDVWQFQLKHVRTETEGPTFDQMEMQLEVVAAMTGSAGLWHLKAAEVFEVLSVTCFAVRRSA